MNLPKDKGLHFTVCACSTLCVAQAVLVVCSSLTWSCVVGTAFTAGLAPGKEYGDKNATGNHWCWWDLLADALGILVAVGIMATCVMAVKYWLL